MKCLSSISKYLNASFYKLLLLTLCACSNAKNGDPSLTRITLVDRDGLTEVIGTKDRLGRYAHTDFKTPQPYQKVTRLYSTNTKLIVTTYHPNGQLSRYLEGYSNRALGPYREWHANGQKKIEATLIGGTPDLENGAEQSWIFDGLSQAWDDEGRLLAEIPYHRGQQEGCALHYHKNGKLWKEIPYQKNLIHGSYKIYLDTGELFQESHYLQGTLHGPSKRYWTSQQLTFEEHYDEGRLVNAKYYDPNGSLLSQIQNGNGFRALFGKSKLHELQEFQNGQRNGITKELHPDGSLKRSYHTQSNINHGEERIYNKNNQLRLTLNWYEGSIQGEVRSWYENGQLESLREMSDNKKHGLSSAWYEDGSLMLIEEYDRDRLVRGEYHRKGESHPISQIITGNGIATLFSPKGSFLRKVPYRDGKPLE